MAVKVKKVEEMKKDSMLSKTKRERFIEVVGTCVSMVITVGGKDPRLVRDEINAGKYDKALSG